MNTPEDTLLSGLPDYIFANGRMNGADLSQRLRHNSIAPISRLPNELLSRIMLMLYQSSGLRSSLARLYLSWVCTHWRNVALGYPQLWCTIACLPGVTSQDYVQECITRNQMLDFDVDLRLPEGLDDILQLCMSQVHRIRSLTYFPLDSALTMADVIKSRTREGCFEWFWDQPAPRLFSLTLTQTLLPSKPFGGVYPQLKHINLVKCGFHWDFLFSPSTLTTIHIVYPPDRVPAHLLVTKLAMMPSLTELHLTSCLAHATAPIANQRRFPSLRVLYLEDKQHQAFSFFQMIDTPGLVSLRTCIKFLTLRDPDFLTTLDFYEKLHPAVWTDIRHLVVRPLSLEAGGFSSAAESKDLIRFCYDLSSSPHLQLHRLPIHRLETLSISSHFKELPGITNSLPILRSVKYLRLGAIRQNILSGLLAHVHMGEISLPSLMEIHCTCNDSAERLILLRALEQRKAVVQGRLPKLTFEGHAVDLEMFEEVVNVIESGGDKSVTYFEDMPDKLVDTWE